MQTLYQTIKHLPVGDSALLVEFGKTISLDVNQKVHALNRAISVSKPEGVEECVPAYSSLLVYYDPTETTYEKLFFRLRALEEKLGEFTFTSPKRTIEVPVAYGGTYGPDLPYVARSHNLQKKEVIRLHSETEYSVYMIGFVAGFPYLGRLAEEIATPRLKKPRLRVPAGSVGIAEKQSGIYPYESPGGWRIIGWTPLKLFSPNKNPPALMQPGDKVQFKPVDASSFENFR